MDFTSKKHEFDIDNEHKLFKGTRYASEPFGMSIDTYNWYLKATVRAGIEAQIELGTPKPLKEGEVEDITTPDGMHRYTYNKTVQIYTMTKYKYAVSIKDWYGITLDGVDLDCTEDNILKLVKADEKFFDIIYKIIEQAEEKTPEEKVVEMGLDNSSVGSNGTTAHQTAELD